MPKKLTHKFIKEQFAKERYQLLSGIYVGAHTKLNYICPKGHRHSITWGNWSLGYRCPYCVGVCKPTIKFIRSEFAEESYRLLASRYINNRQKLDYICSEGHKHSIRWSNWNIKKQRCPTCKAIKMSDKKHWNWKGGPNRPICKLRKSISGQVWRALKQNKAGRHWEDLVGYSLEDLKYRLESLFKGSMCWENYGTWHIDHCLPLSWFDEEDILRSWSLWNLQPMWGSENIFKSNKRKSTIKII